jgi:hypothetical protein
VVQMCRRAGPLFLKPRRRVSCGTLPAVKSVIIGVCLLLSTACVPLPYATPPVRLSFGGGVPIGRAESDGAF